MNAEDMSAEQLMALARAKAGEASPAEAVEVMGKTVEIDRAKAASWDAFALFRKMRPDSGDQVSQIDAAVAYACLVTGLDEDELVELSGSGGDFAQTLAFVVGVIKAAQPKN